MTADTELKCEKPLSYVHINESLRPDDETALSNAPIPITKVPALDTTDHDAVESSTKDAIRNTPSLRFECCSDINAVGRDAIVGYAHFVSRFTGLDDIAFAIMRHGDFAFQSQSERCLYCASLSKPHSEEEIFPQKPSQSLRQFDSKEVDYDHYKIDEVQFSLHLDSSEDGEVDGLVEAKDQVRVLNDR